MLVETIRLFIDDDGGATAIEYGLLAALISVAAIASFMILGNGLTNLMGEGTGAAAQVIGERADNL
ncbi:Flp family type IVb pilin [Devosia lacusdianchii]|jgi:pilus assembly protein Flp/PilA|uniref:Flp family type IVb pilin n=1 Tax=Devosia lacusdianchii TaxID=2917991 RepID=UPI001F058907|nr:Flp family type IVb pilin [Devosia sp. JXJ CY 41]